MSNLSSIYQDFLISSFGKIEATKFAKVLGKGFSHDRFTKQLLLDKDLDDDIKLWKNIKSLLRYYENENSGCIVIDDTLLDKKYTKANNDVVCWHYDHVSHKMAKGIMMLNVMKRKVLWLLISVLHLGIPIHLKTYTLYIKIL